MDRLRQHITIKFILFGLILSFALPSVVKLHHALEGELHEVCLGHDEDHFHEIHHECDFKIKVHHVFWFELSSTVEFFSKTYPRLADIAFVNLQHSSPSTVYLRGPPALV